MEKQIKDLFLKALLIGIKGIIVLPLIIFLIHEAFITQNPETEMSQIHYVPNITPLCCTMDLCSINDYKITHI